MEQQQFTFTDGTGSKNFPDYVDREYAFLFQSFLLLTIICSCYWLISPSPPVKTITVFINSMDVGAYDLVQFYDGPTTSSTVHFISAFLFFLVSRFLFLVSRFSIRGVVSIPSPLSLHALFSRLPPNHNRYYR